MTFNLGMTSAVLFLLRDVQLMFIVVSSLDVAKKCWFESEKHTGYHTIRYIHSVQYTCTVFIVYKMIKLLNS